ncbi:amino acid permease [Effusibacillus lacus]|uniref:Amino acid permease n=1 Tax=Effusibacillus lacus TaxID=1348429 RepID=A0A292YHR2_9BACL|nr:amino acid permease [Effusibacillus lacus]GAX88536.1 amino acid permease [Effusibacillus lacus]
MNIARAVAIIAAFISSLFRTKDISTLLAEKEKGHQLKKALGAFDLTMLGIGGIIGTGIFVLTGVAAAKHAGPALPLSFIFAGFACAFAALCYAEFSSAVPVSGSVYTYSYATLGEIIAWIIGWDLILEYLLAASTVAVGWSGYFQKLLNGFGLHLPPVVASVDTPEGVFNLPAFLIVLLITWLLSRGVKESARLNNIMVLIKVAVVLLFIVVGVWYVKPANWTPFMPFGWGGVFSGAAFVFFAYIGFDAVATAAEEVRNPKRDLPIGIIASLAICTVLYIIVSALMTGIVPYPKLDDPAPISLVLQVAGQDWVAGFVSLGAILGITTVLMVMLYGQTRIFFAMSRDGLLPRMFSGVHPRFQTPYRSTWLIGVIASALGGFFPLNKLAELVNIGTLAAFTLISIGVIVLRYSRPDLPRSFKVPFVPAIPLLAAGFCIFLMSQLPADTWTLFGVWLLIGLAVYFTYSRRHSTLRAHN